MIPVLETPVYRPRRDQAVTAAPGLDAAAAPELVLAVHLERLPAPAGLELDAVLLPPAPDIFYEHLPYFFETAPTAPIVHE